MKTIISCFLAVVLFCGAAYSTDAISRIGVGAMVQKDQQTRFAYSAGFEIPIVQKMEDAGFVFKNQTSYLYSDFSNGDYLEIQCIRTMAMTQVNLFAGYYTVEGPDGVETKVDWSFHISFGSGIWQFLKTEGEDQTLGAFSGEIGAAWKVLTANFGVDVVHQTGPDYFYPHVNLGLDF